MRIIAGTLKGRTLKAPAGSRVRPTSDRLRETLFNVLSSRVDAARVLDGYAGTGAIGLEALSRGAARVTFIERDRAALAVLRANIAACGASDRVTVIESDVVAAFRTRLLDEAWDLVILDPPYELQDLDDVLRAARPLVAPGGLLVLEHASRRTAPLEVPWLVRTRLLEAGDSALSFYAPVPAG